MGLTMIVKKNKKIFVLSSLFCLMMTFVASASLFDFFTTSPVNKIIETNKDLGFLVDSIEFRKRQLENINKLQVDVTNEMEEVQRYLTKTINDLSIELSGLIKQQNTAHAKNGDTEVYSKKITLLNDRLQQLHNFQELLHEYQMDFDTQIKHLKSIIDEFVNDKREDIKEKRFFVLQDLQNREESTQRLSVESTNALNKKESLLRQKIVLQEKIASYKNEYEARMKEKEKAYLHSAQDEHERTQNGIGARFKFEILEYEAAYLKERIDYGQWQLKKVLFDLAWADDEYVRLKSLLSGVTHESIYIKKHLLIDAKDVARARNEWKHETEKITLLKPKSNANREGLRLDRDRKIQELNLLNDQYKKYKDAGDTKNIQALQLDSQIARLQALLKKIDMQLLVLEAHNDMYYMQIEQKYFAFKHVQSRFKLSHVTHIETINEWINDFKGRRSGLEHELRVARNKREEALNSIAHTTSLIDGFSKKGDEVMELRDVHFRGHQKYCNEILSYLSEAQAALREQLLLVQAYLTILAPLIPRQEALILQYDSFVKELEQHRLEFNIWYRSSRSISLDGFKKSLKEGEFFFKKLFWAIPQHCNPFALVHKTVAITWPGHLIIILFFLIFLLFYACYRLGLQLIYRKLLSVTETTHGRLGFLYLNIFMRGIEFIKEHALLLFSWIFLYIWFRIPFSLEPFLGPIHTAFWAALFFLLSIFVFIYLSTKLLASLKILNQTLSFFFFNEQSQHKFITLTASVLYASSILLPLRTAFVLYGVKNSELPEVVMAAYSLILLIVLLLFFTKEDVLKLIPSHNDFWLLVQRGVQGYYYPVFLFFMGLFILANPYIGYSHLAWFLAFAVPITTMICVALVMLYHYIRQYSVHFFFKEEGEDIVDRFEHAKMYYGFFVLFSLFLLILGALVALTYLWGFSYSLETMWRLLSDDWAIKLGGNNRLGIIQVFSFVLFVIGGFLLSSVSTHFLLNRLFDIFKTEPGAQNTISRILHYCILVISVLFGLATIGLAQLILPVSYLLIIGIGLGIKDQIADFFAGFLVLLERQIEIGNFIEVNGTLGTVQKIAVRSTTIRTARNLMVIIPNRTIISTSVINYSRHSIALEIRLVLRHDTDVAIVKSLLFDIVIGHPMILRVPSPIIRLEEITDVGELFLIRGFISSRRVREMWDVASDIRIAIMNTFKEKSIRVSCVYPLRVEMADKITLS